MDNDQQIAEFIRTQRDAGHPDTRTARLLNRTASQLCVLAKQLARDGHDCGTAAPAGRPRRPWVLPDTVPAGGK